MMRRSQKYQDAVAQWDIVGGRIDAGTTLMENLRREVMEEAGLEIVGEPKLIAAQDILRLPERHIVRLTYAGRANGEPRLSEEHTEYGWFTLAEIKRLKNLDRYLKEVLKTEAFS